MSLFCRHKWKLIDKHVIPPAMTRIGNMKTHSVADTKLVFESMRERVVHVFQCEKCTKVKKV